MINSNIFIAIFICFIIMSGLYAKINVYDSFVSGAKKTFSSFITMVCPLIALVTFVSIFRASGTLDILVNYFSPITDFLKIPKEILQIAIIKPISGSASLVMYNDVLENYGPDSIIGKTASVMMSSTETTLYVLSVYFGSIKVFKSRHALKCALITDIIGIFISVYITKFMLK